MHTPFSDFQLGEPLLRALDEENYREATAIQAAAIPLALAGKDILAVAQTGTGKTAAFALPILHQLSLRSDRGRGPHALVLAPTRELAVQVGESFRTYGRHLRLRSATVFGGVSPKPQIEAFVRGVDILVATPGRLLDLAKQRALNLGRLSVLVLDEADRMLDMGFLPDIKRILALLPKARQTMLFSATMPNSIGALAATILKDPVRVEAAPPATTVEGVNQQVIHLASGSKQAVLTDLLRDPGVSRALVFSRTKHGASRIAERLVRAGIGAEAIHGNKSQNARQRALGGFSSGRIRVLVATDVASRGIDVNGISHVFNFDIPNEPDTYVHRIGRTARAGASGVSISFCDPSERKFLADIEKLTRVRLQPIGHAPIAAGPTPAAHAAPPASSARGRPKQGGRRTAPRRAGSGHAVEARS